MTISTWTGLSGNGLWLDAGNWSNGVPTDIADFTGSAQISVNLAGQEVQPTELLVSAEHVRLNNGFVLPNSGSFGQSIGVSITRGGSLLVGTKMALGVIAQNGRIDVGDTVNGITSAGTLVVNGLAGAGLVQVAGGSMLVVDHGGTLNDGPNGRGELNVGVDRQLSRPAGPYVPGSGKVLITGSGSTAMFQNGIVGGGSASSILDVRGGGSASFASFSIEAGKGSAAVLVSDAGSSLTVTSQLTIGGGAASSLTVLQGATLDAGTSTINLAGGMMVIDPSARVVGSIFDVGGVVTTVPAAGCGSATIDLTNPIQLGSTHSMTPSAAVFSSDGNAVLRIDSVVLGTAGPKDTFPAIFAVGHGHVILSSGDNQFATALIESGTLEIAATGAAGAGVMNFGIVTNAATLQLDPNVTFSNLIAGFGSHDFIDLAGFNSSGGVSATFDRGQLTLKTAGASASLTFAGHYSLTNFVLQSDQHGGTTVAFRS